MGSKNLFAIAADGPNPKVSGRGLKDINRLINLGEGSKPYRDDGAGGTWRHIPTQHAVGGLPEFNFHPPDTQDAVALQRASVEAGPFVVKAESCYLCGIKCHKNVYDEQGDGEAGSFRAKVDYEPWALLSSNLGLYDQDEALDRVELVDQLAWTPYLLESLSALSWSTIAETPIRPLEADCRSATQQPQNMQFARWAKAGWRRSARVHSDWLLG